MPTPFTTRREQIEDMLPAIRSEAVIWEKGFHIGADHAIALAPKAPGCGRTLANAGGQRREIFSRNQRFFNRQRTSMNREMVPEESAWQIPPIPHATACQNNAHAAHIMAA
jgi:hypothetical protein